MIIEPYTKEENVGKHRWKHKFKKYSFGRMVPNIITLISLCVGLSSLQFAFSAQWEHALTSILVAAFLDGLDGRLARILKVSSDFGAELDSLADFINFGVAPAVIIYSARLHLWGNKGWAWCLFFACCMALRLARFNVQRHIPVSGLFSQGVPAPAAALVALLPITLYCIFHIWLLPWVCALVLGVTSILMISRYPTFVFKKVVIHRKYHVMLLTFIMAIVIGFITIPWETLLLMTIVYFISLPISGFLYYKKGIL